MSIDDSLSSSNLHEGTDAGIVSLSSSKPDEAADE